MAIVGRRVTVAATATKISAVTANRGDEEILVRNADASAAVDLGGSDVTTGTGFSLAAGAVVAIPVEAGESLYGITASGTVVVHVLESGV